MANVTVEDFLNARKSKPAAEAYAAAAKDKVTPVLQMKKFACPKVKSAGSEDSTLDPVNSQETHPHKKK